MPPLLFVVVDALWFLIDGATVWRKPRHARDRDGVPSDTATRIGGSSPRHALVILLFLDDRIDSYSSREEGKRIPYIYWDMKNDYLLWMVLFTTYIYIYNVLLPYKSWLIKNTVVGFRIENWIGCYENRIHLLYLFFGWWCCVFISFCGGWMCVVVHHYRSK